MSDAPPAPSEGHAQRHHAVVRSVSGKTEETIPLPLAFSGPLRPDLVKRAVDSARAARRQPHGTKFNAGRRHSVMWSGKGKGVSRTPRLMDSNRGAQAPNTVSGGAAHPPKVETIWTKRMNTKERRLAFRAALAATRELALARTRGHEVPDGTHLPIVVADPVEGIAATADARELLAKLKLWADVDRAQAKTHVRSGRGKRRGRYRREPKSLLLVTSVPGRALGFRNLPGIDVVPVGRLGTEDLAPGGTAGRLTIFSRAALEALGKRLDGVVA